MKILQNRVTFSGSSSFLPVPLKMPFVYMYLYYNCTRKRYKVQSDTVTKKETQT